CSAGAGPAGLALMRGMRQATGAAVAASDDATGAGGDWLLESASGKVTALAVLSPAALAAYPDRLALGVPVAWGDNTYGQTSVPAGLSNVVAVAAGFGHSLAVRSDGTVVAWGSNSSGETNVPAGLSDVVAVAGGDPHSLALRADGT